MKTLNRTMPTVCRWCLCLWLAAMFSGIASASFPFPIGTNYTAYTPMSSWSFRDYTNWTDDAGYFPVSYSSIGYSYLGDGSSLVVDTNVPAWLQYNVWESDGTTNLTVENGTLMFWFAASSWSSTNAGGAGPNEWTQLMDVGELTTNASYGYWGLSVDPPGQNLWFMSQDGAGDTYALSTPVAWTTNYFHFIALTYSSTNVSLYLDGELATNDPGGLSIWPPSEIVSNGVFFGSDPNGLMLAHGLFNTVETFNYPLGSNAVQTIFNRNFPYYGLNPWNTAMFGLTSGTSSTTTYSPYNSVKSGSGNLMPGTNVADCVDGTNIWNVWITNVVAKAAGNGNMTISFTIEGSSNSVPLVPFDVFANSILSFGPNGAPWAWEGQGYRCTNYSLTVPSQTCFLILGTPQDSAVNGLTDAYKMLVAKVSTNDFSSDGTGMADGWEVLYFGQIGVAPNADPDGDGLTTIQEWLMNSQSYNPVNWHSFTNSVVGDGFQNYNGDGLPNVMQSSFGGNMLTNNVTWRVNISGDGLSDEYKTMVGLNTNSAAPVLGLPAYSQNPVP